MIEWENYYNKWIEEKAELIEKNNLSFPNELSNSEEDFSNQYNQNIILDSNYYKKLSKLKKLCILYEKMQNYKDEQKSLNELLNSEKDTEMKKLCISEIEEINVKLLKTEENLFDSLISLEEGSIILEIRSAEGGDESKLFAAELMEMYSKLSRIKKWNFNVFSITTSNIGGISECVLQIKGAGVVDLLSAESGVHCVKRVPKTEKKGRIHTSTATVAILPEPEEIDIKIEEKDIRIDVFRSSGPGGQSVNTTDSAVRITHIPTGVVVSQQDEKSQHKNKDKGMKILRARVFELKKQEQLAESSSNRKNMIGNASRSERIRTYHFSQNWVKDDRVNFMIYDIDSFMDGTLLPNLINQLAVFFQLNF